MSAEGILKVDVVTPERAVLSVEASSCTLPTMMGQIEVLPGHIPLITGVDAGELVVIADGKPRLFYIEGGFAEVANNVVSVLTDSCFGAEEFDVERARRSLKRVEGELEDVERRAAKENVEASVLEELQEDLRRARQRIAFGEDPPKH